MLSERDPVEPAVLERHPAHVNPAPLAVSHVEGRRRADRGIDRHAPPAWRQRETPGLWSVGPQDVRQLDPSHAVGDDLQVGGRRGFSHRCLQRLHLLFVGRSRGSNRSEPRRRARAPETPAGKHRCRSGRRRHPRRRRGQRCRIESGQLVAPVRIDRSRKASESRARRRLLRAPAPGDPAPRPAQPAPPRRPRVSRDIGRSRSAPARDNHTPVAGGR